MPAPAFPAFAPSSRTFTPGSYLQASYQSLDGRQTNVAHSNAMISSRLALQFSGLSEAEMFSILQHYHGQLGAWGSFQVPAETFSGFPGIVVGTGAAGAFGSSRWRYAESPTVTEFPSDVDDIRFSVTVQLETVPPIGAIVGGALLRLPVSLAVGAATASSNVNGISLSIGSTLATGPAAAYLAPGSDLTITWSMVVGEHSITSTGAALTTSWSVSGGAAANVAPGASVTATCSLTPGAATA